MTLSYFSTELRRVHQAAAFYTILQFRVDDNMFIRTTIYKLNIISLALPDRTNHIQK
jgi:hypothetical protein